MTAIRRTLKEVHEAFAAQGVSSHRHYATRCPICGTVQSMASLVAAGVSPDKVDRVFGFSCEGRFTGAGPWPGDKARKKAGRPRGCDWSLGGLFSLHKAEVERDDGSIQTMFDIASPEEAQALEVYLRNQPTSKAA